MQRHPQGKFARMQDMKMSLIKTLSEVIIARKPVKPLHPIQLSYIQSKNKVLLVSSNMNVWPNIYNKNQIGCKNFEQPKSCGVSELENNRRELEKYEQLLITSQEFQQPQLQKFFSASQAVMSRPSPQQAFDIQNIIQKISASGKQNIEVQTEQTPLQTVQQQREESQDANMKTCSGSDQPCCGHSGEILPTQIQPKISRSNSITQTEELTVEKSKQVLVTPQDQSLSSCLIKNLHRFRPVHEVLSHEFLSSNGISQTEGLSVYIQDAQDPSFDPSSIFCSNSFQGVQEDRFLSQNIHMPDSREYLVYYFLRSNTQTRLFKLFQCKHKLECGKTCQFSIFSMSKYFDHLRTHTGERPFKCAHCDMRFSQKGNLDKHTEMIHLGVAKFMCPHCEKPFTKKFNLQVHLRNIEKKMTNGGKKQHKNVDLKKIRHYLKLLEQKKLHSLESLANSQIFSVEKIER